VDEGIPLDQTKMTIIAGSDDPVSPILGKKAKFVEKKEIESVKIHPLSAVPAARYDLALVKIKGQFTFRDSRWPICIPNKTESKEFHFNKGYTMLGFGRDINKVNKGSVLTELYLSVQPTGACSSKYGKILNDESNDLHIQVKNTLPKNFNEDSLLCASKPGQTSGSCPGDSGGILMNNKWIPDLEDHRSIQTAVVHGAAKNCNGGRYPPIFVRIDTDEALTWINTIVFSKTVKCKEIRETLSASFPTYIPYIQVNCEGCQCGTNAMCKDKVCQCPSGFTGDPFVSCTDSRLFPNNQNCPTNSSGYYLVGNKCIYHEKTQLKLTFNLGQC